MTTYLSHAGLNIVVIFIFLPHQKVGLGDQRIGFEGVRHKERPETEMSAAERGDEAVKAGTDRHPNREGANMSRRYFSEAGLTCQPSKVPRL